MQALIINDSTNPTGSYSIVNGGRVITEGNLAIGVALGLPVVPPGTAIDPQGRRAAVFTPPLDAGGIASDLGLLAAPRG